MSKIYSSQLELVGHTPLVEVQRVAARRSLRARLLVKLESYNPAGSVKDRTALAMNIFKRLKYITFLREKIYKKTIFLY